MPCVTRGTAHKNIRDLYVMTNSRPSNPSRMRHVRHRIQDGLFAKSARSRIDSELTIGTLSLMRLTIFPIRLMVHAVLAMLAVSTSHAADPKTLSVRVRLEKTTANARSLFVTLCKASCCTMIFRSHPCWITIGFMKSSENTSRSSVVSTIALAANLCGNGSGR